MNRNELIFCALGGAGGRLVDKILTVDPRFAGYFINTSMTDIESLESSNSETKNYFCISTNNGVGRNRKLGKSFARQSGYSIIDVIERFNQDTIYFVTSFGGGSGSALLSELLRALEQMKSDEDSDFNKTINVIAILPDLNSPTVILKNARDTWNEVVNSKCVNSVIYINNNCKIDGIFNDLDEKELKINEIFAKTFSSIFDIPAINGIHFDNGNLSNLLKDKGCLYFYDLPSDCSSIEVAISKSESNSILGKMYRNEKNTIIEERNGREIKKIKCGYLGISLADESFDAEIIAQKYKPRYEPYVGESVEKNLVLISGCMPPLNDMKVIELEIEEREKEEIDTNIDFSDFVLNKNIDNQVVIDVTDVVDIKKKNKKKAIKKVKKGLF
ncbi:hypothetical protein FC831_15365 [Clostridium botulinum]|nr:hypothetical protein [Clostridium botulinum]